MLCPCFRLVNLAHTNPTLDSQLLNYLHRVSLHIREGRAAIISFLWLVRKLSLRLTEHLARGHRVTSVRYFCSAVRYFWSLTKHISHAHIIQKRVIYYKDNHDLPSKSLGTPIRHSIKVQLSKGTGPEWPLVYSWSLSSIVLHCRIGPEEPWGSSKLVILTS